MKQQHTSKETSINSTKLPAIYSRMNEIRIAGRIVIDCGCGKYTDHLQKRMNDLQADQWYGYDPYNQPEQINSKAEKAIADVILCSNVLNVIDNEQSIMDLICWMDDHIHDGSTIYCKVYEGKANGIGHETQNGQSWQRNQKTAEYLRFFHACGLNAYITTGSMIVAYR